MNAGLSGQNAAYAQVLAEGITGSVAGRATIGAIANSAKVSSTTAEVSTVEEEVEALQRIGANPNGPILNGKASGAILDKQAQQTFAELAEQYNDPKVLPRDFQLKVGDKVLTADPVVSTGAPVYSGATTSDVMGFFRRLAGVEDMPSAAMVPGKGIVYSVKITSGPNAGSAISLRNFSTSAEQTGAVWTIDVKNPAINNGRFVELKLK